MVTSSENYNLKSIRARFRENGVFYTPLAQAVMLKQFAPDNYAELYAMVCWLKKDEIIHRVKELTNGDVK